MTTRSKRLVRCVTLYTAMSLALICSSASTTAFCFLRISKTGRPPWDSLTPGDHRSAIQSLGLNIAENSVGNQTARALLLRKSRTQIGGRNIELHSGKMHDTTVGATG